MTEEESEPTPTMNASSRAPETHGTPATHETASAGQDSKEPKKEEWLEFHLKKQEGKRVQRKKKWMIGVGVLVLVVAVALIAWNFSPKPLANDQPIQPVQGQTSTVNVQLLVDKACPVCFQSNTLLQKFDEVGIQYDLETLDIESVEGIALYGQS